MRGFCLLLVVFATLYRLASAQSSPIQRRLIAEQEDIACTLKEDRDLLRTQFEYMIRALHGVQPNFTRSTYVTFGLESSNTKIRCRADRGCSEDAEVVWCFNMYHPSEDIEMCWNFSSGEISMTDYARRLGINEIFYRETTSPQDSSLWVRGSPYFLSNSFLTCTVESQACSAIAFHRFEVKIRDPVIELSNISVHNSTDLLLGQTLNVFLCIAELQNTETFPMDGFCSWSISVGMENITYVDLQGCDPLQDSYDCFVGTGDENRIRFYYMRYNIRDCPLRTFLMYSWLVIENATKADSELLYTCEAHFTATNPVEHLVSKAVNHSLTPIYPSLEIIPVETPSLQAGTASPYLLKPDEMLQWNCSVQAGEGDSLVWLLNGTVIPSSLDIDTQQDLSCSLDPSSEVFSVSHEPLELGEFQRLLTSTLLLCRVTKRTVGTYQCAVNRTRGDDISITEVWSASIQSSPEVSTKIGNSDTVVIIVVCAVSTSTLLILIITATLICCCLRHIMRQREQRKSDWTKDIFVMDDILHITGTSPTDKSAKNQVLLQSTVDPLEFPRNKLVFLNTILGKGTFGVVLQAKAEDIVKSAPHRNIVAVKTTREKAPPHEINNFWEELQLMKQMIPHGNVINLLGHCTTPGGPIYMIIEYARYGSLKDFLKECEQVVLQLNHLPQVLSYRSHQNSPCSTCSAYPQLVDKTQLNSSTYSASGGVFSPDSTSTPSTATTGIFEFPPTKQSKMTRERLTTQDSGFGDYSPQLAAFSDTLADDSFSAHSVAPLTHDYVNSKGLLYMEDVQNFALQIACGLKHLEESQIVHCDLAARNILIAEGFVLKIGDFGMARDVSEKEYYRKQGGRIPVKWTAPEALTDHIFTFKSDIWSYGVVLWEVLTYGQQPYPKLKIRHSWEPFINYLMEGNRLSQPKGCPDSIYDLMQSCWHSSPEKRPTADELVRILSQRNLLPIKKTIAAETSI